MTGRIPTARTLTPAQLTAALAAGAAAAGDDKVAGAVVLLTSHGYWMQYGHLRRHLNLSQEDGRLLATIRWTRVAEEIDARGQITRCSSTELAVLEIACSLAGRHKVNLGEQISHLSIACRTDVLDAVRHALSGGGRYSLGEAPSV